MALEPTDLFLPRPPGAPAIPIGGSIARPEQAIRAVLKTSQGGVIVTSIVRQADGSFIGEVYGITPGQRSVAVGDLVSFGESQMFTFKAAEQEPLSPAAAEMADIIRTFNEKFNGADLPPVEPAAAAGPNVADFTFDLDDDPRESKPEQPAPVDAAPSPRPVSARPMAAAAPLAPSVTPAAAPAPSIEPGPPVASVPSATPVPLDAAAAAARSAPLAPAAVAAPRTPAPTDRTLSTAEAYSILGGAKQDTPESQPARVDNPALDPGRAAHDGVVEHPVACLECGATLPPTPSPEGPASAPAPSKVSCARCGRINDVVQAEAASRRRRLLAAAKHDAPVREDGS